MNIITLALLSQLVSLAPPSEQTPPLKQAPPTQQDSATDEGDDSPYHLVTQLLAQGIAAGDVDPASAIALLEVALAGLSEFAPQLAADDTIELRASAYVSLARAHLLAGDDAKAAATMDEAIRSTASGDLPVELYGPAVEKLWRDRSLHALAHPGQIVVVNCKVKCRVYLNERRVTPKDMRELTTGTYRLWVESANGSSEASRRDLVVKESTEPITIQFPLPKASVQRNDVRADQTDLPMDLPMDLAIEMDRKSSRRRDREIEADPELGPKWELNRRKLRRARALTAIGAILCPAYGLGVPFLIVGAKKLPQLKEKRDRLRAVHMVRARSSN